MCIARAVKLPRRNELDSDRISFHTNPKLITSLVIESMMVCRYGRKKNFRFKVEVVKSMTCTSRVIEYEERCRTYKVKVLGT